MSTDGKVCVCVSVCVLRGLGVWGVWGVANMLMPGVTHVHKHQTCREIVGLVEAIKPPGPHHSFNFTNPCTEVIAT